MRAFVLLLLITSTACGESECIADPMAERIDPQTGTCIVVSNSDGCMYCVSDSVRCVVADARKLDYARCRGACLAVTEAGCLATDGCRAGYQDGRFFACWGTAPSGPVHTGACVGLDAHECSRHDNCASWFITGRFDHCVEELPVSVMAAGT